MTGRQPVWVLDFSDEAGHLQFSYLVAHALTVGFRKSPQGLLHWPGSCLNVQAVFRDVGWDAWHVGRTPGKYVPVLLKEGAELGLLIWIQAGSYRCYLGRIHRVNLKLDDVLAGLERCRFGALGEFDIIAIDRSALVLEFGYCDHFLG